MQLVNFSIWKDMGLFFFFFTFTSRLFCLCLYGCHWAGVELIFISWSLFLLSDAYMYAFSPCRVVYICGVRFGFSLGWITFLVMSLFVCPFCSSPTLIIPVIRFACIYRYLRTKDATVYLYPLGLGTWLRNLVFFFLFLFLFLLPFFPPDEAQR